MSDSNQNRHVFILRIWRESRELAGKSPEWRGEIECVRSGERRFLKRLHEIAEFVAPYLDEMGVRLEFPWQIKNWLKQRKPPILEDEQINDSN